MGSTANNTVLPVDMDEYDDNAWCTGVMIPESEAAAMLDDEDDISIFGSHAEFPMTPTTTAPMPTPIITCRPAPADTTSTTFTMDNMPQPPRRVSAEGDAISAFSTAMSPQALSPLSASPLAILASAAASQPTTMLHTPLSLPANLSSIATPNKVTKTKRSTRTSLKTKLSRPVLEKPPTEQDYLRLHRKQVQEAYRLNSAVYHTSAANTIKTILYSKASHTTRTTATAKKKAPPRPTMTEEQYLQMYEAQSTALRDRHRIRQPPQQQQQQTALTTPREPDHIPPTVMPAMSIATTTATTSRPTVMAPPPLCTVSASSMATRMPQVNTAVAPETTMTFAAAASLPSTTAAATASLLLPAAAPPSARPMNKLLQRTQQRRRTTALQRQPASSVASTSVVYPSTLYAPDLTLCPTFVHSHPSGSGDRGASTGHSSSPHDWNSSQTTTSASSPVSSFLQQQYPKHT